MKHPRIALFAVITIAFGTIVGTLVADDMKAYLDSTDGSSSFAILSQESNELIRIQSDGLVGIGTNNPTTELEVVGTVSATAFAGDGSLISNLTETDPVWVAASNGIQAQINTKAEQDALIAASNSLWSAIQTKTDQSTYASGTNDLWADLATKAAQADFASSTGALWNALSSETALRQGADASLSNLISTLDTDKLDSSTWTAADPTTNYTKRTGDTLTGALTVNAGGDLDLIISSAGTNVLIGSDAVATEGGVSVGYQANGESSGTALGMLAAGNYNAVAIGQQAIGQYDGVAVGYGADGSIEGVAVGKGALGSYYSIAIGHEAEALGNFFGESRIAIGHGTTNNLEDNSAAIRGTLYLDGGTGVLYRVTPGDGAWVNLLDGLATGTPLYVESDSVWTAAQAAGFTMGGALVINSGAQNTLLIQSGGTNISIGNGASSELSGLAIGYGAQGVYESVAIGYSANAGRSMPPTPGSVAIGHRANAAQDSVAIGRYANAGAFGSSRRIAIGPSVTNLVNESTAVRGTLYLDGGTGVLYRSSFGTGAWQPLVTADAEITLTVPYEICNSNISNDWKNNTSAEDWQWNQFAVAVNGTDHTADGVIDVKLRIYGQSDNGSSFYVGLRNETDATYPIAHAQTGLGSAGWWDSAWTTVTNATLKEFRVSAYTANASDYYYIKRATLLVRGTRPIQE
ncbi:MAG: hypothetical protein EOM20_00980 [Spartobacteria bacterium]|nr:hypothetical protein [Spartobacteria bacterium]